MQRVFEMLLRLLPRPPNSSSAKFSLPSAVSLTSSIVYILGRILALQGMAMIGLVPFKLLPVVLRLPGR